MKTITESLLVVATALFWMVVLPVAIVFELMIYLVDCIHGHPMRIRS